MPIADAKAKRETFFKVIYGDSSGFVCISRRQPNTRTFHEEFFKYPEELGAMTNYIDTFADIMDVYYCPQLFDDRSRTKEHVVATPTLWADLDACPPEELAVEPSILIESSPRRYQALWIVPNVEPAIAEDVCRRIAYYYSELGADKSGWDLTQLLRVPFTYNHKYTNIGATPQVKIVRTNTHEYTIAHFDMFPEVTGFEYSEIPFPDVLPPESAEDLLQTYRVHLKDAFWKLFNETPEKDWSRALWQCELFLAEAGMTKEEMYIVASEAACNKYKRDGRSNLHLWKEVCKAFAKVEERTKYLPTGEYKMELPDLLTDYERLYCLDNPTIIERYVEWAKSVGDAAWQYHQAGAFVVLSSLLAGRVRLPTSFGIVVPNVWFMILADTTLTRKTTAMDMAVDMLVEVDSNAIIATDGSIEGLLTSLSFRPGRPSLFLRDEFSGLLEAMTKKEYYAGMAETLTKLYDGKFQKRILRKETIEVKDPCLIFFAGGIKSRTLELLTGEQVASGFVPRFIFISAESDVANLRPLGPPTDRSTGARNYLVEEVREMVHFYQSDMIMNVEGRSVSMPRHWDARLTDDAWHRYNRYESEMLELGLKAERPELATPTFDRLAKSGLKLAVLLAAAEHQDDILTVEEQEVIRAFYYIEQWRPHTLEILNNIGQTASEKLLNALLRSIRKENQMMRSHLMQRFHLTAQQTEASLMTLEQRGLIIRSKDGRTEKIAAVL